MPFVEAWYAVEGAEAAATADAAAAAAAEAAAADAAAAAAAESAATTAGTAAAGAELAGLGQIGGTAGAQLGSAVEGATAIGGEGAGSAGIQQAMQGAMQQAPLEFTGEAVAPQGITQAAMSPQQQAYMQASTASTGPGITSGVQPLPATTTPAAGPYEGLQTNTGWGQQTVEPININPQTSGYGNVINNGGMNAPQPSAFEQGWGRFERFAGEHPYITGGALYTGAYNMGLLDPRGAQMNNQPYDGPLSKYRLSDKFQAGANQPNTNQYKPTYPSYAGGGIMEAGQDFPQSQLPSTSGYANPWQTPASREPFAGATDIGVDTQTGEMRQMASGGVTRYAKGNLTETLDFYRQMMDGKSSGSAPSGKSDPGAAYAGDAYYDMDPDTRYQDALTAAQIRQSKLNKRANMQLPSGGVMKRPTPMGSLNLKAPGVSAEQAQSSLDPENAAHGGIMQARHSTLGGYAAGGNPRLLKGPGDGMSDNIPATIAGKQPARLADGEFVVPADVVSHLGNGSTDAGAKKLHEMMTEVRKARTGNPKQGKQINPRKFMPK